MLVKRTSILSNVERELDLDITESQMLNWLNGMHIQHAFSNLSDGEREFIKTGITTEEWDEAFKED
tara:strand:+ start:1791 stop:1988 length:198 start_codon:yes stop_codon:yes gene_type:complete